MEVLICCATGAYHYFLEAFFSLSKVGWENSNRHLVTTFFCFAGMSIFTGSLHVMYEYKKNIAYHSDLYSRYSSLESEILTHIATLTFQEKENSIDNLLVKLITENEEKLADLHLFLIEIEPDSIPFRAEIYSGFLEEQNQ